MKEKAKCKNRSIMEVTQMFIWTAIDVDEQLTAVKKEAKRIEEVVGFRESNITLPLHISLKISCEIPDGKYEEVVRDIKAILNTMPKFEINVRRIELHETIAWIAMEENVHLKKLHASLVEVFLEKYQMQPHKFDLDFKFHTTLFLDSDESKVKDAFLMIKDIELPTTLVADKFVIGMSPEGKVGTYRVTEEMEK